MLFVKVEILTVHVSPSLQNWRSVCHSVLASSLFWGSWPYFKYMCTELYVVLGGGVGT